ncbi:exodeoxyribonuclease VII small subunit [Lachnoclostridium sp. Marseille-P6806]|uniref:exodeoxyribonuclease VII small subunit n=1 Tax=Lachnoclostridium sp. Marseille-P6806 TaxID=2364793 RepID=UPI00103029D6|nr:exodeoxyribonuclease VII small subunit [Lachnoclostridium sp. Marseille-P6806]
MKKKPEEMQENTIEQSLEELQGLLEHMQDPQLPLEEAFALYERGMRLTRSCSERIDAVEKKVQKLAADGSLEDFALRGEEQESSAE